MSESERADAGDFVSSGLMERLVARGGFWMISAPLSPSTTGIKQPPDRDVKVALRRSSTYKDLRDRTHTAHGVPAVDVSSRFGQRLRELRRERKLTQTRMSAVFGIDRSFISDVERGRKSISLAMLEVIALGLEMTLSDLLRGV